MKDEALKQAREIVAHANGIDGHDYSHVLDMIDAALEQPEQSTTSGEPVAWGNLANWCLDSDRVLITDKDEAAKYHRDVYDLTPLYTTPPQRKPLTDEQIQAVAFEAVKNNWDWLKFARAIEAAHGIKGDA